MDFDRPVTIVPRRGIVTSNESFSHLKRDLCDDEGMALMSCYYAHHPACI